MYLQKKQKHSLSNINLEQLRALIFFVLIKSNITFFEVIGWKNEDKTKLDIAIFSHQTSPPKYQLIIFFNYWLSSSCVLFSLKYHSLVEFDQLMQSLSKTQFLIKIQIFKTLPKMCETYPNLLLINTQQNTPFLSRNNKYSWNGSLGSEF